MTNKNTCVTQPQPLRQGDNIYITAPASYENYAAVLALKQFLLDKKVNPILSPHTTTPTVPPTSLSASDDVRQKDLQQAINDSNIKAIWSARGGYGTSRIIANIDFSALLKHPKWIIGFSDITLLLLSAYSSVGVTSIHGPMASYIEDYSSSPDITSTWKLLFDSSYCATMTHPTPPKLTHFGMVKGRVLGGNLSLIMNALGTPSEPDWKGCILMIEDVGEYIYAIERNLINMKRRGIFNQVAGVVVGTFEAMKDTKPPLGETVVGMLEKLLEGLDIPVAVHMPYGHGVRNAPWMHGAMYKLEVTPTQSTLSRLLQG